MFFDNEYGKYTINDLEKIIKETDAVENNIGLIDKWSELGFSHYYEWFFGKWSRVVGTKEESEALENMLKEHKIL